MSEFRLSENEKLQGAKNFQIWYTTITGYLKAKKLHKHIEKDLPSLIITPGQGKSLTKAELEYNQELIANDAAASTIIFTNVSDTVKMYIKDYKTAKERMSKILDLYKKDDSAFYGMWMNRLYTIRAKHIQETMDVINEITELFRLLSNSSMNPSNMEKLTIMYDALPASLQNKVNFSSNLSVEEFYNEIKSKNDMYMYKMDRGSHFLFNNRRNPNIHMNNNRPNNFKYNNDPMDVDNIEKPKHKKLSNNISKYEKYCVICFNKGHIARDCHYNPRGTNKYNNRSKFRNDNNKNNNKRGKESNGVTYNIETNARKEFTPCYEEIQEMFGEPIGNIEYEEDTNRYIDLCSSNIDPTNQYTDHVNHEVDVEPIKSVSPDKNEEVLSNVIYGTSRDQYRSKGHSTWTFDTGASEHITNNKDLLHDFKENPITMSCANNSSCHFEGYGTFYGMINGHIITLDKVLYSPDINKNLISGIKLANNGIFSNIKNINNTIHLNLTTKNDDLIASIKPNEVNIVRIKFKNLIMDPNVNSTETDRNKTIWHNRLGHFYIKDIEKYLELHEVKDDLCKECSISKMKRSPHKGKTPKASKILETIHSDIIGPIKPISIDGMRYILTFIDEFSRKSWVFPLKDKAEATSNIIFFLKYLENHYENKVKFFMSDNGREYNNSKIKKYCRKNGIKKIFSPPYNPENNGLAERFNQTLVNSAKTLLFWAKMSLDFWSYAIIYANFLYNITPKSSISNLIPNEIFYNKAVDLSKIKVFGCSTYYNNIPNKDSKFNINSNLGVFLGINFESNCYMVMDCKDQKVHLVREATFLEDTPSNFKYISNSPEVYEETNLNSKNNFDHKFILLDKENPKESSNNDNNDNTTPQPNQNSIDSIIPFNYQQATTSKDKEKWQNAIDDELKNLYSNNIMQFVKEVPKDRKIISTKWVFTIKRDENNNITKYKARLVARGFTQIFGTDFDLTYSPTLNSDSLKFIIVLAAKLKWNIYQLDIKAAYLNADLDKTIYVNIPPGDINYKKGFWKLNKALYGLRQSGRQWYKTISDFLIQNNYIQLNSEPCVFRKYNREKKITCIIGLYVDDMLICGNDNEIQATINIIKSKFKISNSEPIKYILGITVEKSNFEYYISQRNFIDNLLSNFNIPINSKSSTPCNFSEIKDNKPFNSTTFKSAIGSLIYLAKNTRPDICFAVHKAARNCENPTYSDWQCILSILKYLNQTKDFKIKYDGQGKFHAYADADFAGDTTDRKSTSGYIFLIGNSPICWTSKKQSIVATSTAEAEYISTSECTKKALWFRNVIYELFNLKFTFTIFTDNKSSKIAIENGELNTKLKHISIKFYFNYDNIKYNRIKLEYKNTNEMLADALTKNTNGPRMKIFTDKIFSK